MKKLLVVAGVIVVLVVLLVGGGLGFLFLARPDAGEVPKLVAKTDAETVERGRYLAQGVAGCMACHSTRDWTIFTAPLVAGTEGMGGEVWDEEGLGFLVASNITPAGVGDWSDGELYRAIAGGVTPDGEALFPLMPYPEYGTMDVEDITAIIAYLRTHDPIETAHPERELGRPLPLIVRLMPSPPEPADRPAPGTPEYGEYLTAFAACTHCHTLSDKGKPLEGMEFAGGFEMTMMDGTVVRSANITPHESTGIGMWSEAIWLARFGAYAPGKGLQSVAQSGRTTNMPWTFYAQMTDEDLAAIYDHLMTYPPVDHQVDKFPK